jgi:hypothetical protein
MLLLELIGALKILRSGQAMYTERYLTFADILGFADIVKKSARDSSPQRHDALVKALVEAGTYHPGLNASDDIQFQTFSDSIVMSSASTATGARTYSRFNGGP